jgi:hypothetical protein
VELYLHSSNTPSWRGAQLKKGTVTALPLKKHSDSFTFTFSGIAPIPKFSTDREFIEQWLSRQRSQFTVLTGTIKPIICMFLTLTTLFQLCMTYIGE